MGKIKIIKASIKENRFEVNLSTRILIMEIQKNNNDEPVDYAGKKVMNFL